MKIQDWFEMKDIRDRQFANSAWITLREEWTKTSGGEFREKGYVNEYASTVALAVAEQYRYWGDELSVSHLTFNGSSHEGSVRNGEYRPADLYDHFGKFSGIHLVLEQNFTDFQEEKKLWHLHQDLVLALGLKHEGSEWVRPAENYVTVVREQRCDEEPQLLQLRSYHLKDYLCARQLGLLIVSKRTRTRLLEHRDDISWPAKKFEEKGSGYRLEGRISECDKDGYPLSRDSSGASASSSGSEAKMFHVSSELTQKEWIPAAPKSVFVRRDGLGDIGSDMTDADVVVEFDAVLAIGGNWFWFGPALANAIVADTEGVLKWDTRDTGTIGFAGYDIPFGVNKDGKINVLINDFDSLPKHHQRQWKGYVIYPEDGESCELLLSQVFRKPAKTRAPEADLSDALKRFREVSDEKLESGILKEEKAELQEIRTNIHRFRAVNEAGLKSLAKDLCRIFADSINIKLLRKHINGSEDTTDWGSLKILEKFLAQNIGVEDAPSMMGPLFGIQKLRGGDAHPPSRDYSKEFELIGIDRSQSLVVQGRDLIAVFVETLNRISTAIEE